MGPARVLVSQQTDPVPGSHPWLKSPGTADLGTSVTQRRRGGLIQTSVGRAGGFESFRTKRSGVPRRRHPACVDGDRGQGLPVLEKQTGADAFAAFVSVAQTAKKTLEQTVSQVFQSLFARTIAIAR
jgi:hypothetical protein